MDRMEQRKQDTLRVALLYSMHPIHPWLARIRTVTPRMPEEIATESKGWTLATPISAIRGVCTWPWCSSR